MTATSVSPAESVAQYIAAIDLGTTNVKCVLVDVRTLAVVGSGSLPAEIAFPQPGWVEQDGNQLWQATVAAIRAAIDQAGPEVAEAIVGVTISNQRESVLVWDSVTGEPCGPVLGWQDTRTADFCDELKASGAEGTVSELTGLQLDPMYSAPKLRALYDAAIAGGCNPETLLGGTLDTWLVYKLTGNFLAELGNASRTLLVDIRSQDYDQKLLEIFGIPRSLLAPVVASDGDFGTVFEDIIPGEVPILAVLADSHSALYYHGRGAAGEGKGTYGTGTSIMVPVKTLDGATDGTALTIAWRTGDQTMYAYEGNIVASGAALDWMSNLLVGGDIRELDRLAESCSEDSRVQFVPAFSGLGAPYFDRRAVGLVQGLTGGAGREEFARAALEAVCQQVTDVVQAVEESLGEPIETLHADGGGTASVFMMQLQADLLGRAVTLAGQSEASALGAALLGAQKTGITPGVSAEGRRCVSPQKDDHWRAARRDLWKDAVARSRFQQA